MANDVNERQSIEVTGSGSIDFFVNIGLTNTGSEPAFGSKVTFFQV
jgi:hypothetical protein